MKKREKILAAIVAAMVALYMGSLLFENALKGPLDARQSAIKRRLKEIDGLNAELSRAREAGKELAVWEAQSLPSNLSEARALYQQWLAELINRVGLADLNVGSSEPGSRKGSYSRLVFSVQGRGTLAQLVEFLFEFYSADHLHQIQKLDITPSPKEDELNLSITIEALSLPGADRANRLNNRKSDRLASGLLADYQPIVDRDLFSIGGSGPDATDYTYLTAVVDVDGTLEAWFTLRATDQMLKLRVGETLDIGQFRGSIAEIVDADVIIESEGERWLLTVGENLAHASSLPPEY